MGKHSWLVFGDCQLFINPSLTADAAASKQRQLLKPNFANV